MPLVEMRRHVTGHRDGLEWPPIGGTLELPQVEADRMVLAGFCRLVDPPTDPFEALNFAELKAAAADRGINIPTDVRSKAALRDLLRSVETDPDSAV